VPLKFKTLGCAVKIYHMAKIINPQNISIGDGCQIDDFTFINGGQGLCIGKHVHFTYFSSLTGTGTANIGDYAGIAAGARIYTATNVHENAWSMSAVAPDNLQKIQEGHVEIGDCCFIGTNSVVLPNVRIGEGSVVGALSLVNKDIEPWSINVGIPCKKIGIRKKPDYPLRRVENYDA
jgi:acetyltransferase-like isoleucine patch superfamily enzyme